MLTKLDTMLLFLLCLAPLHAQTGPTLSWQKINADGLFTFRLPQGFKKTGMTGVENYLGEYFKGETRFLFVWSDSGSDEYDGQPQIENYRETETRIDGKRASIRTFSLIRDGERRYRAELNVGDWRKGKVELYMDMESKDRADLAIAKRIFKSVIFSKRRRA
jgi:hypothetical protein